MSGSHIVDVSGLEVYPRVCLFIPSHAGTIHYRTPIFVHQDDRGDVCSSVLAGVPSLTVPVSPTEQHAERRQQVSVSTCS